MNDFTTQEYAELIKLAKANYPFLGYDDFESRDRFVLWRHDCDFSLNRSLRLAQIEHELGVSSTFFINPHCEFYNFFERSQFSIIKEILSLGHSLGLHFDAHFYDIESEAQLGQLVARESRMLREFFGVEINAFSFHNPSEFLLTCEAPCYGGLVNCYSSFFKQKVPYCSDSNGYWRFKPLREVLIAAESPRLQVLTHPGWWQEQVMPPRARIVRCVEVRATRGMNDYDQLLEEHDRKNIR